MMILISALAWRPQGRTVPHCSVLFQQLVPKISPLSTEQKVGNEGYKLERPFATPWNHILITSLAWEHILVFILIWPDSNQYSIHRSISTSTEPHNILSATNISVVFISKLEVCSPERQLQDLILRDSHIWSLHSRNVYCFHIKYVSERASYPILYKSFHQHGFHLTACRSFKGGRK